MNVIAICLHYNHITVPWNCPLLVLYLIFTQITAPSLSAVRCDQQDKNTSTTETSKFFLGLSEKSILDKGSNKAT